MSDLRISTAPVPPADYLAECLERLDMSQAELARRASLTKKHVHELLSGDTPLTPETAAKLSQATGRSARYWLQVEAAWQAHRLLQERQKQLSTWVDWARGFPLSALRDRGVIPSASLSKSSVEKLLQFFGVASPEAFEDVWATRDLAYRRGHDGEGDRSAVMAWLRLGELAAHSIRCQPYTRKALQVAIPFLRGLTRLPVHEGWGRARQLLRECGVALVLIEEFRPLTKINGAANWVRPDKVVVQVSSRTKRVDVLWWNIFHELGHVLHDPKGVIQISTQEQRSDPESEDAADAFAARQLIPSSAEPQLNRLFKKRPIEDFADQQGIGVDIVVGRLLNDGQLKYHHRWATALLRYYDLIHSEDFSDPRER